MEFWKGLESGAQGHAQWRRRVEFLLIQREPGNTPEMRRWERVNEKSGVQAEMSVSRLHVANACECRPRRRRVELPSRRISSNQLQVAAWTPAGSSKSGTSATNHQPILIKYPTTPRALASSALYQTLAQSGVCNRDWRSCPENPTRRVKCFLFSASQTTSRQEDSPPPFPLLRQTSPEKPHAAVSHPQRLDEIHKIGTRRAVPNQAHDEDQQSAPSSCHPAPRPP